MKSEFVYPFVAFAAALCLTASDSAANAPPGRYSSTAGSGLVYDSKTKLTWQQNVPQTGIYTWGSAATAGTAQNYCATLNGTGGWRLPTIGELQTLIDFSQATYGSFIDPTFFPNVASSGSAAVFWSSTPVATQQYDAWQVNFSLGRTVHSQIASVAGSKGASNVRCVR